MLEELPSSETSRSCPIYELELGNKQANSCMGCKMSEVCFTLEGVIGKVDSVQEKEAVGLGIKAIQAQQVSWSPDQSLKFSTRASLGEREKIITSRGRAE